MSCLSSHCKTSGPFSTSARYTASLAIKMVAASWSKAALMFWVWGSAQLRVTKTGGRGARERGREKWITKGRKMWCGRRKVEQRGGDGRNNRGVWNYWATLSDRYVHTYVVCVLVFKNRSTVGIQVYTYISVQVLKYICIPERVLSVSKAECVIKCCRTSWRSWWLWCVSDLRSAGTVWQTGSLHGYPEVSGCCAAMQTADSDVSISTVWFKVGSK